MRAAASSSIFIQQPYRQDTSFLIVGERVNASGSKKMRDLLNAEDWDGLVSLAREQEREGAQVLDVNVDFVGRDGEKDMHELASRLVTARFVARPFHLKARSSRTISVLFLIRGTISLPSHINFI